MFTTHYTPKSYSGITGVIAGSVYTVLAFGGFEGAAPLAEEAKDPRRTIRRAVLLATLLIGLLYVFTTYAVTVVFGPSRFGSFLTSGAHSWEGLARSLFGLFWFFVFLAIVNSTLANSNAGVNVATPHRVCDGPRAGLPVHLRGRLEPLSLARWSRSG